MNLKSKKNSKVHMLFILLLLAAIFLMIPFLLKKKVEYDVNNQMNSYCSELVLTFPETAQTSYEEFLQTALGHVTFHAKDIEKKADNLWNTEVSFQPVDLEKLLSSENLTYVKEMKSTDMEKELTGILEMDNKILEESKGSIPIMDEICQEIKIYRTDDGLQVDKDGLQTLLEAALPGYMNPYTIVAEAFDVRQNLEAYLDAHFKGELELFSEYSHMSEEEAKNWYQSIFTNDSQIFPEDLAPEITDNLMEIYRKCEYDVGIVRKRDDSGYSIEIDVVPNMSLKLIREEMNNRVFDSEREVYETYADLLEQYAQSPVYGDREVLTFQWNQKSLTDPISPDSEFGNLLETILPI
ncbi:hypothetical protein [Sporofaciens sp. SGI.106]|uniref:hypothetical protein n=1 Tax=Sporofaciens sp. SGI.106 TaxID=3420568 RepID=UPI002A929FC1|nr:hypothetical protein [Lachnoclostridium sp.]